MKSSFQGFPKPSNKPSFTGFIKAAKDSLFKFIALTAVTVVGSAYDTSGNGGRKVVVLPNGWLVSIAYVSGTGYICYKSSNFGITWSALCHMDSASFSTGGSLTSFGTNVYALMPYGASIVYCTRFDATTVTNIDIFPTAASVGVDTGQTALGTTSIKADSTGVLYGTWASKNATFPNSFNIRYSKSTDGGATWAAVTQITTINTAGVHILNPSIVISGTNIVIATEGQGVGNRAIFAYVFVASWSAKTVYTGEPDAQANPCGLVKQSGSNIGRMWTGWHGLDGTDTAKQNVRANWSDDNGATWNTGFKLTSGNTVDRKNVTLSESQNGDVYAIYDDNGTLTYQVCLDGTTTFVNTTVIQTGTNPSALERGVVFLKPLIAYMDASIVKFNGTYRVKG